MSAGRRHDVVLVSGGSRGLGLAMVSHFLARGAAVATFARTPSPMVTPGRMTALAPTIACLPTWTKERTGCR